MKFLPVALLSLASTVESKSLRSNKAKAKINSNKINSNRSNIKSNDIVLSPPIDRMVSTARHGSKPLRSLVGSDTNRKLELSPELAALFDDDYLPTMLSDQDLGDENFVQCMKDTRGVADSNPEIEQASEDFVNNMSMSMFFEGDTMGMKMEFNDEASKELLRQSCATFGGNYEEMSEEISCIGSDPSMGSMAVILSGFATCTANTQACRSGNNVMGMYNLMGFDCIESSGSGDVSFVPIDLPEFDPDTEESAPVSGSEDLPSQDSGDLDSTIEDLGDLADLLDGLLPSEDTEGSNIEDLGDLGDLIDGFLPSEDTEGSNDDNLGALGDIFDAILPSGDSEGSESGDDDLGALGDFLDAILPSEDTEGSESEPDTDKDIDGSDSDDILNAFNDFMGDITTSSEDKEGSEDETDDFGFLGDDGLLGDDAFLDLLITDENMLKCSEEATGKPEFESAMLDFTGDVTMDMNFSGDSIEMKMEFTDEAKKSLRKTCSDIGGFYDEIDKVSCTFKGDDGSGVEGEITSTIIGYATCLPNTKACKAVDMGELYSQTFAAMGDATGGAVEGGCEFEGAGSSSSLSTSSANSLTGLRLTAAILLGVLIPCISSFFY